MTFFENTKKSIIAGEDAESILFSFAFDLKRAQKELSAIGVDEKSTIRQVYSAATRVSSIPLSIAAIYETYRKDMPKEVAAVFKPIAKNCSLLHDDLKGDMVLSSRIQKYTDLKRAFEQTVSEYLTEFDTRKIEFLDSIDELATLIDEVSAGL